MMRKHAKKYKKKRKLESHEYFSRNKRRKRNRIIKLTKKYWMEGNLKEIEVGRNKNNKSYQRTNGQRKAKVQRQNLQLKREKSRQAE